MLPTGGTGHRTGAVRRMRLARPLHIPALHRRLVCPSRKGLPWWDARPTSAAFNRLSGLRNVGAGLVALFFVLCFTGGCGQQRETVLGKAPIREALTVAAAKTAPKFSEVTLAGVMIDKCPVAGCWFRLRDTTGVIKIDTKSAGFAVVNVPLERKVVVSGTIATEGDEITMAANGIRY